MTAKRLVAQGEYRNKAYKVYRDSDVGEYVTRFYFDGKLEKDADYFTDEKADAISTGKYVLSQQSSHKANPAPRKRAAKRAPSLYGAKMKHLESALSALNMLIDKGAEFPDAVIKVSESTGVDIEVLTAEYDNYWRAWSELSSAYRKTNPAKRQAFPNVATATRALKQAEKALADNPNMWPGAAAGFKTVITKANKYLAENSQTHKTNPAPRKRAISRPSQITKKAPTKRLVTRRKKAAAKPVKGYFPNPGKPIPAAERKAIFPFMVQARKTVRGGWQNISAQAKQADAEFVARAIASRYSTWSIRVVKQ